MRIEVLESIKNSFPPVITLVQRGGTIRGEGESNGLGVDFRPGEEYLLHLRKQQDGTLTVLRGSAGATLLGAKNKAVAAAAVQKLTRVRRMVVPKSRNLKMGLGEDFAGVEGFGSVAYTSTGNGSGLLTNVSGIPARFIAPDRGEPVGYLVDAQNLPAGVTQTTALQAVTNALAAWATQTGLIFRFDGLRNFGMSAADVPDSDGRLRISLHDSYGEITSPGVLGIGGRSFVYSSGFGESGGDGGAVNGLEFHKSTRGYVVLQHTNTIMQNADSLEEVLCHELGHALGLAHSSENFSETNTVLSQAIMYYRVHGDGRGAALGEYDVSAIRKIHPPDDTPPFSNDRILTLVTSPTPITGIPGINEILLAANDRQSPSSSLSLVTSGPEAGTTPATVTGSFDGSILRIAQTDDYGDGTVDPASSMYYYRKHVRFSDGVNLSPWTTVRVVAIRRDSQGDGLPDSWSLQHFGSPTPSAVALSRPGDDRDKDGFTNLREFILGTVPVDADSRLAVRSFDGQTLEWLASPYALYTFESSTDLSTWTPFGLPVVPVSTNGSTRVDLLPSVAARQFLRVRFGHSSP